MGHLIPIMGIHHNSTVTWSMHTCFSVHQNSTEHADIHLFHAYFHVSLQAPSAPVLGIWLPGCPSSALLLAMLGGKENGNWRVDTSPWPPIAVEPGSKGRCLGQALKHRDCFISDLSLVSAHPDNTCVVFLRVSPCLLTSPLT